VIRTGVGERCEPELTNAAQALELRGLEQGGDDVFFVGLEFDETVDRVAQDHRRLVSKK
jgi:hypothetical protein